MPRFMPASWSLLLVLMLCSTLPRASGADTPQSVTVYCQSATAGTQYGSQFIAGTQNTAANAYTLTFSDSGAALSTTTGTVIATTSLPPLMELTSSAGILLYPNPSASAALKAQGLGYAEIIVNTGSSLGVGPYGVTGCVLQYSGDPQVSALFTVSPSAAILAATPVITAATTPNGSLIAATVGTALSYQIVATNSPTLYTLTTLDLQPTPLPTGLTLDATTGVISGTPAAGTAGSYVVDIKAINAAGVGSAEATINVAPNAGSPVISSALSATATAGTAFSYHITASNTPTAYSVAAGTLPPGLSLSTGVISGTPTTPGLYEVGISAGNGSGIGDSLVYITVAPSANAPVITNGTSLTAVVGTPPTFTFTATHTPTSFTIVNFSTSTVPGLTYSTSTGVISGSPTTTGIYSFQAYASNAAGIGGITTFTVLVGPTTGGGEPVINSPANDTVTIGTAFTFAVTASGTPTVYALSGQPPGVTINAGTGVISGTPTVAGTYVATVTASNTDGTGAQTLTFTVRGSATVAAPSISSPSTAVAVAGTAFTYQITATQSPTTYAATFLPLGLTLNAATGAITGTPAIAGTSYVTISATNTGGTGTALLVISANGGSGATTGGTTTAATTTAGTTTGGQASSGDGGGGCGLGGSGAALILFAMLALRLGAGRQRPSIRG